MAEEFANQTDEFLAQEASRGVLEAYDELVRRYQDRIYGFVLQTVSNPADAREATQDAFLRAYAALHQFRPGKTFSAWLFAIARNRSIDLLRSRRDAAEEPQPETPDFNDPSELMARQEDQSQIWERARQLLPELQFQTLWLRYVEDMDVTRIATALGRTKTHVKVLLFRARRQLAAEFGPALDASSATPAANGRLDTAPSNSGTNRNVLSVGRESAPTI